ncbi:probable ATP-dependent RNA helicase CG8611 isoform X2 [Drosophila guanche]|uniref:probable ATP-dependent RNA helicase CG8611 isoform X2 n=1 Tax=Drosophila guanche TaxID=7266 RepID=UPI0014713957|nr:probable ATP-dependent RNA helicase CG8611 isoform X2 [Drosophila guanche]
MVDNISLNVSAKASAGKPQQQQKSARQPVGKRAPPSSNFDFQFNAEKPKVKAIVVRRRVPSKVQEKVQAVSPLPAARVPAPAPPPASTSTSLLSGDLMFNATAAPPAAPKPSLGHDLMLNVSATPVAAAVAKPKPKPKTTRAERMGSKKRSNPVSKLSDAQLKSALKRRGQPENPNKLPRAGDIFKAQIEEERKQKLAAEEPQREQEEQKEQKDQPEQKQEAAPTVATNRFRTKKIGLFDQSDVEALKQLGQRTVKPVRETIFAGSKVASLGLHAHAVKNLEDLLSITELTTVQQKTIPHVLSGKDVLVRSQTGSGKTLAYALPLVEKLQAQVPHIKRTDGVVALIIVPTRELVVQTYELLQKLLKPYTWIVPGSLLGGESRKSEKARLRKGINVLVGTPGRLVDHLLHTASFKLFRLQFLVLDEADRLLELGYERDVKQLVEAIDKHRLEAKAEDEKLPQLQRLLLSATLTAQVQELAGLALSDPLYIDNSDEAASAALKSKEGYQKDSIEAQLEPDDGLGEYQEDVTGVLSIPEHLHLSYIVVPAKLRLVALSSLLAKEMAASPKQFKAIIFMSTTEMVNFHHDMLNEALTRRVLDEDDEKVKENDEDSDDHDNSTPLLQGLRFFKLHGSMTQTERQGVFRGFRDCASCVLLATDVVGRGIDVPDIKLVIQYTPPQTTADFVHRVGRTARAGRKGRAVLFLAPSESQFVRHLENKRIRIQQGDMYAYLQTLLPLDDEARTVQEAASNLQHKFQTLLEDDRELHEKSCKAFVSWMKFYSTFPKELKPIFNVRIAHMGHFAKSFALKEAPTKFAGKHAAPKAPPPTNRLTYTERDPEKLQQEKRSKRRIYTTTVSGEVRQMQPKDIPSKDQKRGAAAGAGGPPPAGGAVGRSSFMKSLNKSRALNISEFDSGLPSVGPAKRLKKA